MREDFAERFSEPTERPKNRNKFPRRKKKIAKQDEDGQPPDLKGMRKMHIAAGDGWYRSGSGSDYSILKRFLKSKCGQKWDDIYSEICEQADSRSHDGYQLRKSVGHKVCVNAELDNGVIYQKDQWGRTHVSWWHEFYVHPETKTLEYMPRNSYRHRPNEAYAPRVYECDGNLFHQHAGIWYRVEMKPVPTTEAKWGGGHWTYDLTASFTDVFGASEIPPPPKPPYTHVPWHYHNPIERIKRKYGLGPDGQTWYCFAKQSANSHEIEKLKKKLEAA